jgi:hypothetical protein
VPFFNTPPKMNKRHGTLTTNNGYSFDEEQQTKKTENRGVLSSIINTVVNETRKFINNINDDDDEGEVLPKERVVIPGIVAVNGSAQKAEIVKVIRYEQARKKEKLERAVKKIEANLQRLASIQDFLNKFGPTDFTVRVDVDTILEKQRVTKFKDVIFIEQDVFLISKTVWERNIIGGYNKYKRFKNKATNLLKKIVRVAQQTKKLQQNKKRLMIEKTNSYTFQSKRDTKKGTPNQEPEWPQDVFGIEQNDDFLTKIHESLQPDQNQLQANIKPASGYNISNVLSENNKPSLIDRWMYSNSDDDDEIEESDSDNESSSSSDSDTDDFVSDISFDHEQKNLEKTLFSVYSNNNSRKSDKSRGSHSNPLLDKPDIVSESIEVSKYYLICKKSKRLFKYIEGIAEDKTHFPNHFDLKSLFLHSTTDEKTFFDVSGLLYKYLLRDIGIKNTELKTNLDVDKNNFISIEHIRYNQKPATEYTDDSDISKIGILAQQILDSLEYAKNTTFDEFVVMEGFTYWLYVAGCINGSLNVSSYTK